MFAEIGKQFRAFAQHSPWPIAGDPLHATKLDFGPDWYAVGMTTKASEGDTEKKGKFQGFKSPNILFILSEAQAIENAIYDELVGNLTSSNARVLEIGNPISPSGRFWEHCTQKKFGYNVIKISCFESPNVIANREVIPGVVTKEWIDQREAEWGRTHPYWYSRVLGEFPQSGKGSIIPIDWIMRQIRSKEWIEAFVRGEELIEADHLKFSGLDVSKGGADETVHLVLTGPVVTRIDGFHKVDINETVGWAKNLSREEHILMSAADEGGLAGVCGFLEEENIPCQRIMFGAALQDNKDFANLGARMWWEIRNAFETGTIYIPDDPVLIGQLAGRKYGFTSKGIKRIKLESKDTARSRGVESPDRADALAMAWWARLCYIQDDQSPVFESTAHRANKDMETATNRHDPLRKSRRGDDGMTLLSESVRY